MAFSDIAGGAAQGAGAGAAIGGPWGAAIGGIGGGLLGWMQGSKREKEEKARQQQIAANMAQQKALLAQYGKQANDNQANLNAGMSTLGNVDRVKAFMDPQLELKQQAAANANAHAFGTQGKLLSGARMTALNRDINNLSENAYNNAFNQWMGVENAERDRLNKNYDSAMDVAGNTYNMGMQPLMAQYNALAGQQQQAAPDLFGGIKSGANAYSSLKNSGISKDFLNWMNS